MNHEEPITKTIKLRLRLKMLRSGLCDYSDSYIIVKGTITVENKNIWNFVAIF